MILTKMDSIVIFVFLNKSYGINAWFTKHSNFKHCMPITFDGRDWIMLDFDVTGFITRRIKCTSGPRLLNAIKFMEFAEAYIALTVKDRIRFRWAPFIVRTCNEFCRLASGIDIGITRTPEHLFKKTLRLQNERNYELLTAWRKKDE